MTAIDVCVVCGRPATHRHCPDTVSWRGTPVYLMCEAHKCNLCQPITERGGNATAAGA